MLVRDRRLPIVSVCLLRVVVCCEWLSTVGGRLWQMASSGGCAFRVAALGWWLSVVGGCPSRVAVHRDLLSITNGYPLWVAVSGEWVSIASGLCNECLSIAKGCPLWFAVHGKWLSMTSSCPWQSAVLGQVTVRINRMFIWSRCPQQVALFSCRVAVRRELLFVASGCPSGYWRVAVHCE